MICRECGQNMKTVTVQKARKRFRRGIERYVCSCGYEEAKEWSRTKTYNDAIEESVRQSTKKKIEPSIEPEEI